MNSIFNSVVALSIFLSIVYSKDLSNKEFMPTTPVLKSDIGLLSVNVPPVSMREQYWLHSHAFPIKCLHESISPNLLVLSLEMNFSTTAIMKMISSINITVLSDDGQQRILGPIRAVNSTYKIFLDHLLEVRSRYHAISGKPLELWGLLKEGRCDQGATNDIEDDIVSTSAGGKDRERRDINSILDPKKHNVFNIEGTGHTFVFNHGSPPADNHTSIGKFDVVDVNLRSDSPSNGVPPTNTFKLSEGRIFSRLQNQAMGASESIPPSCIVSPENRLKYLTCVSDYNRPEATCYSKYMQCTPNYMRKRRGLLNFLGDMQNSLFGVATEEQVKKLHDIVNDVSNISLANAESIEILRNSTLSISQHTMDALDHLSTSIYSELDKLTASIHTWSTGLEDNVRRMMENSQEGAFISSLSTSTATIHTYIHILTRMLTTLDQIERYYVKLSELASHRIISPSLVTPRYLSKLWNKVNSVLDDGLELPGTIFKVELAQNSIFQIYSTNTHMKICYFGSQELCQ